MACPRCDDDAEVYRWECATCGSYSSCIQCAIQDHRKHHHQLPNFPTFDDALSVIRNMLEEVESRDLSTPYRQDPLITDARNKARGRRDALREAMNRLLLMELVAQHSEDSDAEGN